MARTARTETEVMKQVLEQELSRYYQNLAVSVFEWTGWPDQKMRIPRRQPEKLLYENGTFTLFKHPESGQFLVLPVAQMNIEKNAYGEPSRWRAMALGDLAGPIGAMTLTPENAVLVRNDDTYSPSKPYVQEMIRQMVNVEHALRLNINANKNPFIVRSSQAKIMSDRNVFEALTETSPAVFIDKMAAIDIEPMNFQVPFLAAELNDAYTTYEQRILEYLGIDCVGRDKAERLTSEEAAGNDEKIGSIRAVKIEQRKCAVDLAHDLWPDELSELSVELAEHITAKQERMDAMAGAGSAGPMAEQEGEDVRR